MQVRLKSNCRGRALATLATALPALLGRPPAQGETPPPHPATGRINCPRLPEMGPADVQVGFTSLRKDGSTVPYMCTYMVAKVPRP